MDLGIVAEAIKGLIGSRHQGRKVVNRIGGRDVIIRRSHGPDEGDRGPRGHPLGGRAARAFDMDNVDDFQILDPDAEGLQMTVLLVAAKRELGGHKLALPPTWASRPASSTWMRSPCTTPS